MLGVLHRSCAQVQSFQVIVHGMATEPPGNPTRTLGPGSKRKQEPSATLATPRGTRGEPQLPTTPTANPSKALRPNGTTPVPLAGKQRKRASPHSVQAQG